MILAGQRMLTVCRGLEGLLAALVCGGAARGG